jgi:DNA-binding NarL/FixJ family response regulator
MGDEWTSAPKGFARVKTRLTLTDDHVVLRQALRSLLERETDLEVVGEAGDSQQTIELVRRVRPDLVLMDLVMPGVDRISTTQALQDEFPELRVVILSSIDEEAAVVAAVRAGAVGYLQKNTSIEVLVETIRAAARGHVQFSPAAAARLVRELQTPLPQPEHLTPRELEVLQHVAIGLANKEIGWKLSISEKTVKSHVSTILAKFGLQSRTQAAMYAARMGFVQGEPVSGLSPAMRLNIPPADAAVRPDRRFMTTACAKCGRRRRAMVTSH